MHRGMLAKFTQKTDFLLENWPIIKRPTDPSRPTPPNW